MAFQLTKFRGKINMMKLRMDDGKYAAVTSQLLSHPIRQE